MLSGRVVQDIVGIFNRVLKIKGLIIKKSPAFLVDGIDNRAHEAFGEHSTTSNDRNLRLILRLINLDKF